MVSRPRRSAAAKANETISVHARLADSPERSERSMSSRRSGRASGVSISRDEHSSPGGDRHLSLTVKLPSNKLRQATRGDRGFEGGEIVSGKRNRGAKKSYVVDSSPDEDEEEEEEAEIEVEEEDDDDMDVDAEGDVEMDLGPPTITVSKPARSKPAPRASAAKIIQDDDDDDDDELSDPADSDMGDETMGFGDETMGDDGDEDAEGEEIEVAGPEVDEDEDEEDEEEDDEGEGGEDEEDDEDEDGNPDESIDLTKMTKRQRARFEDEKEHQYMKLSDEVQAKKVFTAEELSMRRQEMARRRRNLSEKRNEEVKMETINKLLKKQAPKVNRKAAGGASGEDANKPDPVFIRWVSNKSGVRVAVTEEMIDSPAGQVFGPPKLQPGKMVQEVV
ncbi:hypothetical protein FLAG1_02001 [Fusarium langsethiae]|uniref:INO80 complex subunit B-like conserved region domain-containing protein n=1 Tax=Fusarium langsethiae TaxID=179993 RepID=A0A0M9F364_FUSLA|nr:hypothetical protein FLAG1_02001 [Fusarium langsethiae]GKU05473.1 unnamed protein product [Fusarium langsethiae]GKU11846.1 unnamed protein product [Fusarium langsethiae]